MILGRKNKVLGQKSAISVVLLKIPRLLSAYLHTYNKIVQIPPICVQLPNKNENKEYFAPVIPTRYTQN